jgi:hypothetical protein
MKIEKELSKMDLNQFKEGAYEHVIKELYKHQNFNRKAILTRINRCGIAENSVTTYASELRTYLRTGKKKACFPDKFYLIIDNLKEKHCAILTPSEQDKLIVLKASRNKYEAEKEAPKKEEGTIVFGVKIKDDIKVIGEEAKCDGYMACYREFVCGDIQKLVVSYKAC